MTWTYDPLTGYHRIHAGHRAELDERRGKWVLRWGLFRWRASVAMDDLAAKAWADGWLGRVG
ncbi:MAG: hypothetical protein KKD44_26050 [Proteobacteria bacterium]|nr:hypothetical protein [Pseudomonadota bacterium]